ncbi:DUF389 domain-containing protein [Desulfopila sp. IMCC35008]|uniref:DUF389 domain-containing protein n=1 Tax=Desulfopila sp. IMCC35008 TaxID=2653858 RepID=UPI0013D69CE2|nr:DUF389 domain-containing protein [Desulfopila sp. IMCC35008]
MSDSNFFTGSLSASPQRLRKVHADIAEGSEPGLRFYLMVVISTMIAGLGLITNSTAVIIGAMLVAPLMTPIFGISLALIRNDARLLGYAIQAEVVGVVAAVGMGYVLGLIYPGLEPTPEMISRTNPHLFDLLVAVFSGFAGAYALVDEKISPALPGVAIATAIVPPLANTGLCFSLGAYSGGIGSFLLFFSNFLSILLVGSIVFWAFKMSREYDGLDKKVVVKKFGLPIISFFIIAVLLSHSLAKIGHDRAVKNTIRTTLSQALKDHPTLSYEKSIYNEDKDIIYVFADVYSSRQISPILVNALQEKLEVALGKPTKLAIRGTLTETVLAPGNLAQIMQLNLDGEFVSEAPSKMIIQTQLANSTIRNYLTALPAVQLKYVRIFKHNERLVVVASIDGLSPLDLGNLKEAEELLRQILEEPDLDLVVRYQQSTLYDSEGLYHFAMTGFKDLTPPQKNAINKAKSILADWFAELPEASLIALNHTVLDAQIHFLVEISSLMTFEVDRVRKLEQLIKKETGEHIRLHVLSKPEVLTSADGHEPYLDFAKKVHKTMGPKVQEELKKIIIESEL